MLIAFVQAKRREKKYLREHLAKFPGADPADAAKSTGEGFLRFELKFTRDLPYGFGTVKQLVRGLADPAPSQINVYTVTG